MPAITVEQLPTPPAGKTGWPWTTASPQIPASMPDGTAWPRISIITPSFNQAAYLEETIRSVLLQGYPDMEYIVMDGGSRDTSVQIIRKYAPFISYWTSTRDDGQSAAINTGFKRATGAWIGWQNSDDTYEPAAFARAIWAAKPGVSVVYGSVRLTNAQSRVTGAARTGPFDLSRMFPWANMFNQSMLFHRRVFDAGHFIDERMRHYLDHDFFWKLILAGFKFNHEPAFAANFRIHDLAKGATQPIIAANELHDLYKRIIHEPGLPETVRGRAIESMRGLCEDQFGKSRWDLFERFSEDLKQIAGRRGMGAGLVLKRLLTHMGVRNLDRLRRIFGRDNNNASAA